MISQLARRAAYCGNAFTPSWKSSRVSPGKRFSLQTHQRRAEHWFLVSGEGRVTLDEELITLKPGEAVDIPTGTMHRMENPGEIELSFIEVQTGDYFGEDDIERFEDDFGRTG